MTMPEIVTTDLEDSFGVFNPAPKHFEVKAINPDGSIATTIAVFDDSHDASNFYDALVDHLRFWTKVGL